jgi:DNA-binding transcriptional MerR regulator
MKPEYRSLDPVGVTGEISESLASLLAVPAIPSARTWTIGELARECGVTLRALRFYEGKGLLSPARLGGARQYGDADVHRLKVVLRLKRLGFSLVEIRDLVEALLDRGRPEGRLEALLARIRAQAEVLEEQRREIARSLTAVAEEIDGLERHIAV